MHTSVKVACNTSIDAHTLEQARALGLSPSKILEEALSLKVREEQARRWLDENQAAIEENNQRTRELGGTFAEQLGLI